MFNKKNRTLLCPLLLVSFWSLALDEKRQEKVEQNLVEGVSTSKAHPESYYKALAQRAEELFNNCRCACCGIDPRYNEAFSIVVRLVKETGEEHLYKHTDLKLYDAHPTRTFSKKELLSLTKKNVNSFAQAQGFFWLGTWYYAKISSRKSSKYLAKAKNYFKKAIKNGSSRRISARASFCLGKIYLGGEGTGSLSATLEKNLSNKKRAKALSYLLKAQNQRDCEETASYAKENLSRIEVLSTPK
ncbi:hypothetical protein H0X06_06680 [Candidatus Dependentiae bacterium]|nr:hypothetical protein [Candidatus Dependentiae bacterium]